MHELTVRQVMDWCGAAAVYEDEQSLQTRLNGISCDTRSLQPGALFVALRGDRFDGHSFLGRALEQAAGALLIDNRELFAAFKNDELCGKRLNSTGAVPVLLVEDTLKALQDIASAYRHQLRGTVIAVTGSVGKTSTRQMIASCLSPALRIHQAEGNFNNEIGLPQTLLAADEKADAIVLEMGMRGPGEIALLSRIASPDVAVITCIGWSHIGRLGSRAAIFAAKWEIVSGLRPGGLLILNADDPLLIEAAGRLPSIYRLALICTTPAGLAAARSLDRAVAFVLSAGDIAVTAAQTTFTVTSHDEQAAVRPEQTYVTLPFPGHHHVRNALFGLSVAKALRLDLYVAAAGAAVCGVIGNRQKILTIRGITVMDDTYNASPESMAAALEALSILAGDNGRKIAALGCMLELGPFTAEAHRQVGGMVASLGFSLLLVYGPEAEDYLIGARCADPELPSCSCADLDEMAERLAAVLQPGDFLLVKGSRAFALEKVIDRLQDILADREGEAQTR